MTKEILTKDNIKLNITLAGNEEAIRFTGGILVDNGYIEEAYIDKMLEREALTPTYIGNHVAIPHGTEDSGKFVKETGLSLVTVPAGVDFGDGNIAKVLIGIASKGDEHLEVLSKIAIICSEEENVQKIVDARTKEDILNLFDEVDQ